MGAKGSQTKSYQPSPAVYQAGNEALQKAMGASEFPYENPIAPFNANQTQAFDRMSQVPGMAAPYFDQASSYATQGASPVTGDDVARYFDPYAGYVTANLEQDFDKQRRNVTGQLTQAAGGVGADRIAVGQSELARSQGLQYGNTLSDIYNKSLSAAQAEKMRQGQAAYTFGMLGPGAQNASITGNNAELAAGNQQQASTQAQTSSRLAYPFQTAQYLAGITGGVGGVLGGTETMTPAQPSPISQILGLGMAGAGAYGFGQNQGWWGAGSGGSGGDPLAGSTPTYMPGYGSYPQFAARGGRIAFADGGTPFPTFPGGGDPAVPYIQMQPSQPHKFSDSGGQGGGASSGPNLGDIAKMAMMFLADGGGVNPFRAAKGFAYGGSPEMPFNDRFPTGPESLNQGLPPQSTDMAPDYGDPIRMAGPEAMAMWRKGVDSDLGAGQSAQDSGGPSPMPFNDRFPTGPESLNQGRPPQPAGPFASAPQPGPDPAGSSGGSSPEDTYPGLGPLPYGPDRKRSPSEKFANSPWAALMQAGLATMSGNSPWAAINIGKGGMEGIKTLEGQRKEGREEEDINLKAKRLAQQAREHLDKYNKMTPYESAHTSLWDAQEKRAAAQEAKDRYIVESRPDGWSVFDRKTNKGELVPNTPAAGTGTSAKPSATEEGAAPSPVVKGQMSPSPIARNYGDPQPIRIPDKGQVPPDPVLNGKNWQKASADMWRDAMKQPTIDSAGANKALVKLNQIDTALNNLPKDGLLAPGAGFAERTAFVNWANTLKRMAGMKEGSPEYLAAAQEVQKLNTTLGFELSRTLGAREAMQIVQQAISSVPGGQMSPEGARAVISGLRASLQRDKDRAEFMSAYSQVHPSPRMADSYFERMYPQKHYSNLEDIYKTSSELKSNSDLPKENTGKTYRAWDANNNKWAIIKWNDANKQWSRKYLDE